MTERPDVPPEGELISAALKASGLSQRKAARLAGISEGRWRQITSGYVSVNGEKAKVRGPDSRVALMAHVVGATAEELVAAGRAGAAEVLREIEAKAAAEAERRAADADSPARPENPRTRVEDRWRMLRAVLREAGAGLSLSEQSLLRDRIDVFFAEDVEWPSADDLSGSETSSETGFEERHPGAAEL
jgi:transcriptional regulator with XRE-family HTH domain